MPFPSRGTQNGPHVLREDAHRHRRCLPSGCARRVLGRRSRALRIASTASCACRGGDPQRKAEMARHRAGGYAGPGGDAEHGDGGRWGVVVGGRAVIMRKAAGVAGDCMPTRLAITFRALLPGPPERTRCGIRKDDGRLLAAVLAVLAVSAAPCGRGRAVETGPAERAASCQRQLARGINLATCSTSARGHGWPRCCATSSLPWRRRYGLPRSACLRWDARAGVAVLPHRPGILERVDLACCGIWRHGLAVILDMHSPRADDALSRAGARTFSRRLAPVMSALS